jgi:hypothetical protein
MKKSKYRRDTSKSPWKLHTPGLFKSHTEPIDNYVGESITRRLIKESHKSNSGQRVKYA